ncbi:MAG: dicarboxylate/amino acid:cation symporter [Planctomycetia bacterium]|nr:dicarboxylate/amino acid:cation symporter [Planctomycetia bacterium]
MFKIKLALHWQVFIAIVLGILFGCFAFPWIGLVAWMGKIFINLLNMLVIPLLFFLLISAVSNIESAGNLGRLGLKTIAFYVLTTLLAITTGLVLVNLIQPGVGVDITSVQELPENLQIKKGFSLTDVLMNIVPDNVVSSMASGNILSVVFFALFTGCFTMALPDQSRKTMKNFFDAGSDLMMKMTTGVIRLAPYGVFAMIAERIAEFGGDSTRLLTAAQSVGLFFITVFSGLAFHLVITLSVILLFFRINPLRHLKNMSLPLMTAFSTATSNATIPFSLQALEEKDGVSNKIASFTIPLGATLNMNGTALYECVVVLFISQVYGIDLSLSQMIIVTFTALLSAVGTPGIPMASLVMVAIVLNAVHLPLEGIGLILITDRILDMCRTTVNIYGDTCCAACIAANEGEKLNV